MIYQQPNSNLGVYDDGRSSITSAGLRQTSLQTMSDRNDKKKHRPKMQRMVPPPQQGFLMPQAPFHQPQGLYNPHPPFHHPNMSHSSLTSGSSRNSIPSPVLLAQRKLEGTYHPISPESISTTRDGDERVASQENAMRWLQQERVKLENEKAALNSRIDLMQNENVNKTHQIHNLENSVNAHIRENHKLRENISALSIAWESEREEYEKTILELKNASIKDDSRADQENNLSGLHESNEMSEKEQRDYYVGHIRALYDVINRLEGTRTHLLNGKKMMRVPRDDITKASGLRLNLPLEVLVTGGDALDL